MCARSVRWSTQSRTAAGDLAYVAHYCNPSHGERGLLRRTYHNEQGNLLSILTRLFRARPYEPPETRNWSISDPGVVALFGGGANLAGVPVTEQG